MTDVDIAGTILPGAAGDRGRPPLRCFYLARGFTRVFWGLLVAMVLFFGNAVVEFFKFAKLPAYVAGCLLAAWGLWILPAAGAVSPKWTRRVRLALALVLLQVYFAPFLGWWKMAPFVTFYFINVVGLLLVSMLALFFVNLLAADACRRLQDRNGAIEAVSFAWAVILLTMVPLALLLGMALLAALQNQEKFGVALWQLITGCPIWIYVVMTVPGSLTLTAVWKAGSLCRHRLAQDEASNGGAD